MTVAELIQQLQALPNQSLRVVVRGYEDGVNDITHLKPRKLSLNQYDEWYYGKHGTVHDDSPYDEIAVELTA